METRANEPFSLNFPTVSTQTNDIFDVVQNGLSLVLSVNLSSGRYSRQS